MALLDMSRRITSAEDSALPELPRSWSIAPNGSASRLGNEASLAIASSALINMDLEARAEGYDAFLDRLHMGVEHGSLPSVLLKSDSEASSTEVSILIGGFGMRMEEIVKLAEYWRRVHQELGRPTDVLAFDLPRHSQESHLPPAERAALDAGDLSPVAWRMLDVIQKRTTAKTINVLAYSYGNVIAWPLADAAIDRGINVSSILGCALPNPRQGGALARTAGFLVETLLVGGKYPKGTPGVFTYKDRRYPGSLKEIVGELPAIQRRLARNNAKSEIVSLMQKSPGTTIVLAGGGADWIGRQKHTKQLLATIRPQAGGKLHGVLYEGAHHAWGRSLQLLGQLASLAALESQNLSLLDQKKDARTEKAIG
jgi:hypothetical protein